MNKFTTLLLVVALTTLGTVEAVPVPLPQSGLFSSTAHGGQGFISSIAAKLGRGSSGGSIPLQSGMTLHPRPQISQGEASIPLQARPQISSSALSRARLNTYSSKDSHLDFDPRAYRAAYGHSPQHPKFTDPNYGKSGYEELGQSVGASASHGRPGTFPEINAAYPPPKGRYFPPAYTNGKYKPGYLVPNYGASVHHGAHQPPLSIAGSPSIF